MNLRAMRRRRRAVSSGLQTRMVAQFVLTVVGCVFISTLGLVVYVLITTVAGGRDQREFVIVYRQVEHRELVDLEGRSIERRSYRTEAQPQTSRWVLLIPPLLINNVVIGVVLSVFAVRYSGHYAGPVYRMSTDIRRALAGESGVRIQLRRGDELRELAQRLNALLDALDLAESRLHDG